MSTNAHSTKRNGLHIRLFSLTPFQTVGRIIFAIHGAQAVVFREQIERENMQRRVRGASATTGIDSNTLVEAADVEQARDFANQRGILVASIEPVDANLEQIAHASHSVGTLSRAVHYPSLESQSRWTASLGSFFNFIGIGLLILTTVVTVLVLVERANSGADPIAMALLVQWIIGALVIAFLFFTAGAILRILAYIGQAVRDIAASSSR